MPPEHDFGSGCKRRSLSDLPFKANIRHPYELSIVNILCVSFVQLKADPLERFYTLHFASLFYKSIHHTLTYKCYTVPVCTVVADHNATAFLMAREGRASCVGVHDARLRDRRLKILLDVLCMDFHDRPSLVQMHRTHIN